MARSPELTSLSSTTRHGCRTLLLFSFASHPHGFNSSLIQSALASPTAAKPPPAPPPPDSISVDGRPGLNQIGIYLVREEMERFCDPAVACKGEKLDSFPFGSNRFPRRSIIEEAAIQKREIEGNRKNVERGRRFDFEREMILKKL